MKLRFLQHLKALSLFLASVVVTISFSAKEARAYGLETHFFETESMLLWAGIHPAISESIAAYAQWVDVSKMNSAINPIPGAHARVSRLMHFPTEGASIVDILSDTIKKKIMGKANSHGHGNIRNLLNGAERDSLIANELFNEALKTGNHMLIGAALHVLMDSYAHEGFNFIFGHGERGHYPDRPWMFIEKHNEMRKKLFEAISRIRKALPEAGLVDIKLTKTGKLNKDLSSKELFENYIELPSIKAIDNSNPHRSPLYTGEAVRIILENMEAEGTATPELRMYVFENLKHLFFEVKEDGNRRDAWEVAREVINHVMNLDTATKSLLVDRDKILEIYGNISKEYVFKGKKGKKIIISGEDVFAKTNIPEVVDNMITELCKHVIPKPALGDDDSQAGAKTSFENESLSQNFEKTIQIRKWQQVRKEIFGLDPIGLDMTTSLTRLFKFLKKDTVNLYSDIEKMDANVRLVKVGQIQRFKYMYGLFKYIIFDYVLYRATYPLVKIGLLEKPLGNLRLTDKDVEDAKLWQIEDIFDRLKSEGVFKNIYTDAQVNSLLKKWEKTQEKFEQQMTKKGVINYSADEKQAAHTRAFFERQMPYVPSGAGLKLSCNKSQAGR